MTDKPEPPEIELIEYTDPGRHDPLHLHLDTASASMWATQAQIAELFQTDRTSITKHIGKIFEEGELPEEGNVQKLHIAGSTKPVQFYSLDVIISVGYRVNSSAATRFRQWATKTLRAFIEQGYVLNEYALRSDPEKLNKLAAEVRAIRAGEQQIYAKVRECFKISASDYDPSSREVKRFYSLLQDKLHYAVTGQEAAKLIMDRVDHTQQNMGLAGFKGKRPTIEEVTTAKNYLDKDEIYRLHVLSEQFLLYVEGNALAGRKMTMAGLSQKIDDLLRLNEYPVFPGWKGYIRDDANKHARQELELYKKRLVVEAQGIVYSVDALTDGEYDDLLAEIA